MSPRLLLVDDDDDIREVAQAAIELLGDWEVVTAASGSEALDLAESQSFDAVVLDVMMPELDGPSTLQRLRAMTDHEAVPVVFLTAKVRASDRDRFAGMGICGVVTKPFDPMTLADQLADCFSWR